MQFVNPHPNKQRLTRGKLAYLVKPGRNRGELVRVRCIVGDLVSGEFVANGKSMIAELHELRPVDSVGER